MNIELDKVQSLVSELEAVYTQLDKLGLDEIKKQVINIAVSLTESVK